MYYWKTGVKFANFIVINSCQQLKDLVYRVIIEQMIYCPVVKHLFDTFYIYKKHSSNSKDAKSIYHGEQRILFLCCIIVLT